MKQFLIYLLLLLIPVIPNAQYYKDKCISGNCRNGFGINRVSTSKNPLDKPFAGFIGYHYYEIGFFKKGKLNGNGCRFDTRWNNGNYQFYDEKLKSITVDNQIIKPDSTWMDWYQSGEFSDGLMEGPGTVIEWKAILKDELNLNNFFEVRKVSIGNFHLGKLHGNASVTIFKPESFKFDTLSFKYTNEKITPLIIYSGGYENGYCVDCTESVLSQSGVWGDRKGMYLNKALATGWVLKNYEDLAKTRNFMPGVVFKSTIPYKILLIGGSEVSSKISAEQRKPQKIKLANGVEYYGEIDKDGNPFGFGILNGPEYYYEGMVDHGLPHGVGLYKGKNAYSSSISIGGNFERGLLYSGASYDDLRNKVVVSHVGVGSSFKESSLNLINGNIVNGPYAELFYSYDVALNDYKIIRQESGIANNSKIINSKVNIGLTDADIKRQRKIVNGTVKFNELIVGDVVVLDGMASVVESVSTYTVELLDKRKITEAVGSNPVRLSIHKLEEFKRTCSLCKGKPIQKYMYTAPPEEVTYTYYKTETIKSDYAIQTLRFPQTGTYTKQFEPVERTKYCNQCNTSGTEILRRQIAE